VLSAHARLMLQGASHTAIQLPGLLHMCSAHLVKVSQHRGPRGPIVPDSESAAIDHGRKDHVALFAHAFEKIRPAARLEYGKKPTARKPLQS
jgi:hypothetical protein